jgi:hypothetical protein
MNIGEVLSRAFKLSWSKWQLWVIAFLPVLIAIVIVLPFVFSIFYLAFTAQQNRGVEQMGSALFAILCVFVLTYLAAIVVQIVAQGAMIDGVRQTEEKSDISVGDAFRVGWRNAGRMFGSGLLIFSPVLLVVLLAIIVGGAALASNLSGFADQSARPQDVIPRMMTGALCLIIPLYCVLIIYSLFASGVFVYTERRIVLNGSGVIDSIRAGWQMFKDNFVNTVLIALVMFGVSFIFNIVTQIISQVAIVPMGLMSDSTTIDPAALSAIGILLALIFVALVLLFGVWYSVFNSAAWTIAYRQVMNPPQLPPAETGESMPPISPTTTTFPSNEPS